MTKVIKNGTIVTADLTYKADVLIENGVITEIGQGLKGDEELDATGCYVMPGGIDPHTHLEMPFMGTYSSDDFESGTRAGLAGGTTMVVDFALHLVKANGCQDIQSPHKDLYALKHAKYLHEKSDQYPIGQAGHFKKRLS